VRSLSQGRMRALAERALHCTDAAQVRALVRDERS